MKSSIKMSLQYRCPNCQSPDIIEYDEYIECLSCGLEFFKESNDSEINEENILSELELRSFADSFEELKDAKKRKEFLKSLEEDDF
ncbi:MAG: hypothetical protein ACFFDN_44380 [Candidatus Hodarchaeota archaeon]